MNHKRNSDRGIVLSLMSVMGGAMLLTARPMDLRSPNLEQTREDKPLPQIYVPTGADKLLSRNCRVTSSTPEPMGGELSFITDGKKKNEDNEPTSLVKLGTEVQWVQLDLGSTQSVYAVCMWRYHRLPRIYRDVIVQLSNDPGFSEGVTTVFNNDHDNSSGLGIGSDKEYIEWFTGRTVSVAGIRARYVRVYSNGSYGERGEIDSANYYTEIEVYGGIPTSQEKTVLRIEFPKPYFL
jgi:hypothetical protein